jgi:hypothetical protein
LPALTYSIFSRLLVIFSRLHVQYVHGAEHRFGPDFGHARVNPVSDALRIWQDTAIGANRNALLGILSVAPFVQGAGTGESPSDAADHFGPLLSARGLCLKLSLIIEVVVVVKIETPATGSCAR